MEKEEKRGKEDKESETVTNGEKEKEKREKQRERERGGRFGKEEGDSFGQNDLTKQEREYVRRCYRSKLVEWGGHYQLIISPGVWRQVLEWLEQM